MRIGLLHPRSGPPPPPPPLSLPPQAATSMAAAVSTGANHRNVLMRSPPLTPLQTIAANDCDRSGRSAGLSSANARRGSRAARDERRRKEPLAWFPRPVPEPLQQQIGGRRPDLALREPDGRGRRGGRGGGRA